jgi:hypothetical protein
VVNLRGTDEIDPPRRKPRLAELDLDAYADARVEADNNQAP